MLTKSQEEIIQDSKELGWVLEPLAKDLLAQSGLDVPDRILTDSVDEAKDYLAGCGKPVVVKAVSPDIIHKTEHRAVVTDIRDPEELERQVERLMGLAGCEKVLVEEMVSGIEVMVGAKNDTQFGPVVVLGVGGTAVELYNDTAIRLAPVTADDVTSMKNSLKARAIFDGFRSRRGVNMEALGSLVTRFSHLIMDLEPCFESIDLNPVICTKARCVIADARIMLLP